MIAQLKELFFAVIQFPLFLVSFAIGLLIAVLADVDSLCLLVAGVLLALAINPYLAASITVFIYVLIRTYTGTSSHNAGAITKGLNNIATVIRNRPR